MTNRIRYSLDPNYPSNNIRNDYIICHSTDSSVSLAGPDHRLTYRGRIFDTDEISVSMLLKELRIWANSNGEIIVDISVNPLATSIFLIDSACPVMVGTMSYPLCVSVGVATESGESVTNGQCVSIPIFAASLAALLLFTVVVAMMIIVCILAWSQGGKIN